MKKLLVISHSGVVDVNRNIYAEVAKVSGAEVHMIVPSSWKGSLIRDLSFEAAKSDGKLILHPLETYVSGNGSLYFYKSFKKTLKSIEPDLIFCDEEPWSLSAFQVFNTAGETPAFFFTKQNLKKKLPPPFGLVEKYCFKKSAFAVALTERCQEVLTAWKNYTKPIHLFPHGYNPDLFFPRITKENSAYKESLGFKADSILIGYFGRINDDKGITELVEAINSSLSHENLKDFSFLLAGTGELSGFVQDSFSKFPDGKAKYVSAISHNKMGEAMSAIDALILPSKTMPNWSEQFGRVLIEAMGTRSIVLGSDSGEIPYLIRASQAGFVFKEGNSQAILQTLLELEKNRHRFDELSENGFKFASANYTNEIVAKHFCKSIGLL